MERIFVLMYTSISLSDVSNDASYICKDIGRFNEKKTKINKVQRSREAAVSGGLLRW